MHAGGMNPEELPTEPQPMPHDPVAFGGEPSDQGDCLYCGARVPLTSEEVCAGHERYRRWESRQLEWEAHPEWEPADPFGRQQPES